MEEHIMCDHNWVKRGSGSEWGSNFVNCKSPWKCLRSKFSSFVY